MFIQIIPICDESVNITPQNVLDINVLKETNNNVKVVNNDKIIKASKTYFNEFMRQRFNAKVMSYNHKINEWTWLDDIVYFKQLRVYRKHYKYNKIQILNDNLSEHIYNNKTWYSITIQPIDKTGQITTDLCIGSCEIFNYIVSGYVYYYKNKFDRDNAYNYLTK